MDFDLARERGLRPLPQQGSPGPPVVEDNDKNQSWATELDTD
jgi:hypothetical protein